MSLLSPLLSFLLSSPSPSSSSTTHDDHHPLGSTTRTTPTDHCRRHDEDRLEKRPHAPLFSRRYEKGPTALPASSSLVSFLLVLRHFLDISWTLLGSFLSPCSSFIFPFLHYSPFSVSFFSFTFRLFFFSSFWEHSIASAKDIAHQRVLGLA